MKRLLVIGIGSLIMTDDGIGTRIAEALISRLQEHGIPVLIGETDYQYCFSEILPNDILVVIDATVQSEDPGRIEVVPLREALNDRIMLQTQHDFSLFDAISINYPDMNGYFIGVEAAEIAFGFDLSKTLRESFEKICENVFNTIVELKEVAGRA